MPNVAPALSVATRSRRKAIERLERLKRASAYPSVVASCLFFYPPVAIILSSLLLFSPVQVRDPTEPYKRPGIDS
jgi:hypothetical protein